LQYFTPQLPCCAGNCMPFFHLFYLRDENRHPALGGLGAHQWEHVTSSDLIHWQQHPLALSIEADWEKSICRIRAN
jgi:beta-fructofuranosidase